MSAKSSPGDGLHGRGVKGGRIDDDNLPRPLAFVAGLVRGLIGLRRR